MTGQLRLRADGDVDPYVRAWWALDDGEVLELRDVRRFGRIGVVPAGEYASLPTLAAQGPEPWDPALDDGGLWRAPAAQPGAGEDAAPVAAAARRGRQHLRRRGAVAGRRPPGPALGHPGRGGPRCSWRCARCSSRGSPTAAPPCATTATVDGRAGPQPARARLLRPRRRALPALRHRAAPHGRSTPAAPPTARPASPAAEPPTARLCGWRRLLVRIAARLWPRPMLLVGLLVRLWPLWLRPSGPAREGQAEGAAREAAPRRRPPSSTGWSRALGAALVGPRRRPGRAAVRRARGRGRAWASTPTRPGPVGRGARHRDRHGRRLGPPARARSRLVAVGVAARPRPPTTTTASRVGHAPTSGSAGCWSRSAGVRPAPPRRRPPGARRARRRPRRRRRPARRGRGRSARLGPRRRGAPCSSSCARARRRARRAHPDAACASPPRAPPTASAPPGTAIGSTPSAGPATTSSPSAATSSPTTTTTGCRRVRPGRRRPIDLDDPDAEPRAPQPEVRASRRCRARRPTSRSRPRSSRSSSARPPRARPWKLPPANLLHRAGAQEVDKAVGRGRRPHPRARARPARRRDPARRHGRRARRSPATSSSSARA